jgi:hypothetical protein
MNLELQVRDVERVCGGLELGGRSGDWEPVLEAAYRRFSVGRCADAGDVLEQLSTRQSLFMMDC